MLENMDFFSTKKPISNGFIVEDNMICSETTEGSEDKFFIEVNNEKYLVKDSSYNKRRKQKSLAPYCEYTGSHFINLCGVDCQETYLGVYYDRPVVICKDLFKDVCFKPFRDIHQSSVDSLLANKEYTYDDVLYVMSKMIRLQDNLDDALHKFWEMFVMDAILGNRDRHEGNWGFIKIDDTYKFSPIFDNGSSLFPDVDLSNWMNEEFISRRTFYIPGSQFKMWKDGIDDRPMRTNYFEVFQDAISNELFCNALEKFSKIDIIDIIKRSIIDVPTDYARWFSSIIYSRFNCLVLGRDFSVIYNEIVESNFGLEWSDEVD